MRALATIQRGQECIGHEYTTAKLAYDYDFQSSSSYGTCKLMIRLRIFTQLRKFVDTKIYDTSRILIKIQIIKTIKKYAINKI